MPSAVAFRYARSLVDVVTAPGSAAASPGAARDPRGIARELQEFEKLLAENVDLQILLSTPAVPAEKKRAVLADIARLSDLDARTGNFLQVILAHERMSHLGEIAVAFDTLLNERLGVVIAGIRSARPLTEEAKQQLAGALRARTGKQVEMHFSLDPELIAGVVVELDSTIYDASVRGQLERLRAELGTQAGLGPAAPAAAPASS